MRSPYVCDLCAWSLTACVSRRPRDAEVGKIGGAVEGAQEDVGGFNVSVDYSACVNIREAGEGVMKGFAGLIRGERGVGE